MKKIIILLAALCCYINLAIAQSQLQTYSVYDVNHNNEVKVDDAVAVANRAIGNTKEESQVVDAAAINSVLKTIKGKLEAIETRISVIEGKIGVETPAPTNSYTIYYGELTQSEPSSDLMSKLTKVEVSESTTIDLSAMTSKNNSFYIVYPKTLEGKVMVVSDAFSSGDNNFYDGCDPETFSGDNTYNVNWSKCVTGLVNPKLKIILTSNVTGKDSSTDDNDEGDLENPGGTISDFLW